MKTTLLLIALSLAPADSGTTVTPYGEVAYSSVKGEFKAVAILVRPDQLQAFVDDMKKKYEKECGKKPVEVVVTSSGVIANVRITNPR